MQLVVFGANGRIGSVVVKEALARGHSVTAAVRAVDRIEMRHPQLVVRESNITDAGAVEAVVASHGAVINAVGGMGHDNPRISIECMAPLVAGMSRAGVRRLLVVGTASTLIMPQGGLRKDQPEFPDRLRTEAEAHAEVLEYLRQLPQDSIQWTYFSPPAQIESGSRTGKITLGKDHLLVDDHGRSYISYEDYAMAAIDELEHPKHVQSRFTAVSALKGGINEP